MRKLLLAAGVMALTTVATAQTSRYTATLATPLPSHKEFIANGNAWRCDASSCILASAPIDPLSLHSCRELVRLAGKVTAYGTDGRSFDADKLAKCNA